MKADHNFSGDIEYLYTLFPMVQRYLNESRPQHSAAGYDKEATVSNGSKILK
mgnify:CR=1 FL=1